MTINEMFKKVSAYNEMNELLGVHVGEKIQLVMFDNSFPFTESHFAEDYKSFKKLIKETYIERVADAILGYKDYEFNKQVDFEIVDAMGYNIGTKVEFGVCEA